MGFHVFCFFSPRGFNCFSKDFEDFSLSNRRFKAPGSRLLGTPLPPNGRQLLRPIWILDMARSQPGHPMVFAMLLSVALPFSPILFGFDDLTKSIKKQLIFFLFQSNLLIYIYIYAAACFWKWSVETDSVMAG